MSVAVPAREEGPAGGLATVPVATDGGVEFDHEEVVVRRGERSGRHLIVAVHSTALGPALGGLRMWHYDSIGDAVADALRLASGMTLKAAVAGLDLGGGKGVICTPDGEPPRGAERSAMLLDFGDLVESLGGRYITAEDVGTSPEDMIVISRRTRHLTGLPRDHGGSGDPSPFTALGVEAAMRACAREAFGRPDLAGLRIAIVGLGHVGTHLARRLVDAGAEVIGCDVAPGKRALARRLGLDWVDPAGALSCECDVLAPCALGGALDATTVEDLRCGVVCGSANNQLAWDGLAERLAERGVLYAPDYIVNAGGLMHVYMEIRGYDERVATDLVRGIESTLGEVLMAARRDGITPLAAAGRLAAERLAAAGAGADQVRH